MHSGGAGRAGGASCGCLAGCNPPLPAPLPGAQGDHGCQQNLDPFQDQGHAHADVLASSHADTAELQKPVLNAF